MPCALTQSLILDCRTGKGGIKEIKAKVLPSSTTGYSVTSGVATLTGAALTGWYTWQLPKETAFFSDVLTVNTQNGTVFSDQNLTLIANQLRASVRNEVENIAANSLQVAIRLNDGTYWLLGYLNGLDLQTSTGASGTGLGDRNGYELVFKGSEPVGAYNISSSIYDALVTA